jgi:hypothetical protein
MPIAEPVDEDELEAELATMEQEKLDADMLKTGPMPVTSPLNRLPNGPKGESKLLFSLFIYFILSGFFQFLYCFISCILRESQRIKLIFSCLCVQSKTRRRRRRRRGRIGEVAEGNGYVKLSFFRRLGSLVGVQ